MREAQEETGLSDLLLIRKLGVSHRNMKAFGLPGIHKRHYDHLTQLMTVGFEWMGYEETPSDGSLSPIAFWSYWMDIDQAGWITGGLDEMIPKWVASRN